MTDPKMKRTALGSRRKVEVDEVMRRWERADRQEKCGPLAAALRDAIREDSQRDLLSVLCAWVEDAAERGWLLINEHGYAVASVPSRRWVDDVPRSAPDWFEQVQARRRAEQARVMANFETLRESNADNAEEKSLNQALEHPRVQHAALRALGIEMVEPGMLESMAAGEIVDDLAMVRNAVVGGVPEVMLDRIQPLVASFHERREKTWEAGLILSVRAAMLENLDARARVDHVLGALRLYASEGIHPNLLAPSPAQITRATNFLRTLRHADLKKEFWPPAAKVGPGKPLSARGAAARFAECFDVEMVEKASRAKRRKT